MSSLERAKKFVQSKAKALALTIVPLAAIAVSALPANASVLSFNAGSGSAFYSHTSPGSFTTSNASVTPLATYNGVTGVEGSGTATFITGTSGSWSIFYNMSGLVSGGPIIAPVPLFWLFEVEDNGAGSIDWDIAISLNGAPVGLIANPDNPFGSFAASFGNHVVSGSALIPTNPANITSYDLTLTLHGFTGSPGTFINFNIPAGSSIDINPVGDANAAPEPAAFLLAAPALGILALRLKRKKSAA